MSELYSEEGQLWLRVSPGHAVSERWLEEQAPDLYAQWWGAPSVASRDQLALLIEQRLEELESAESWEQMALRHQQQAHQQTPAATLPDKVAAYEGAAATLGALPMGHQDRLTAHRALRADGDTLRSEIASEGADGARDLLSRRLEAADLVADRPFIEALVDVPVDHLAVQVLAAANGGERAAVATERVQAEMAAEDQDAALRAEVLLAVAAAGHDVAQLQDLVARRGIDLGATAPALVPASDFFARHAAAIDALLDREIAAGGFRDLPTYVASWQTNRPASASLHDIERAVVEHVVASVITTTDTTGRESREASRMWERAADRAELCEWSAALERGDIELASERPAVSDQQLELGLHVDDDVDAGYHVEQEVG